MIFVFILPVLTKIQYVIVQEKLQYRDAARNMDLEELNMDEESDPEQRELDEHEQEEQAAELARKRMKHEEVQALDSPHK